LRNFSFTRSWNSSINDWHINLRPINNLSQYAFRCDPCSGLTPQSLSTIRSGRNPASFIYVDIKQLSAPVIETRQVLRNGAAFRLLPAPYQRF